MNSHDIELGAAPKYSALSQTPFLRRNLAQRPTACPPSYALPPTPNKVGRQPSFATSIATWASHVQPGSPAPASPQRRPSGYAGAAHGRKPSSPSIAAPTPKTASRKTFDFTAIGYNAFFVHVPKMPASPSPLLRAKAEKDPHRHEERVQQKAQAEGTKQSLHYRDERIVGFASSHESPKAPSSAAVKPGPMLLSLPARSLRAGNHLRKPRFYFDVQAFALAMQTNPSANEAKSPRSPLFTPDAPHVAAIQRDASSRFRTRRRPAPLTISPAMQRMRMVIAVSSPGSGVPPLSSRATNLSYSKHLPSTVLTTIISPVAPAAQLFHQDKRELVIDYSQPEVSIFEDDSECDFVR